jgi:hypothetical protein
MSFNSRGKVFSVWSAPCNSRRAVFCAWFLPRRYKKIWKWEFTSLEFQSFKGTTLCPEEELEDFVYDVTCAIVHSYWECAN